MAGNVKQQFLISQFGDGLMAQFNASQGVASNAA